jgi:hypothetical protein
LEDGDNGLAMAARQIFADRQQQLIELDKQVSVYGEKILVLHRSSAVSKTLGAIPGIGPITATALLASLGDGKAFDKARQVPAWLGLVPKQDSSGGKPKLLGISKRGDTYLRTLLGNCQCSCRLDGWSLRYFFGLNNHLLGIAFFGIIRVKMNFLDSFPVPSASAPTLRIFITSSLVDGFTVIQKIIV